MHFQKPICDILSAMVMFINKCVYYCTYEVVNNYRIGGGVGQIEMF